MGPFNNHSGSILLLSSPFTNINLHVKIVIHVWEVLDDHLLNPRYQSVSELRPHHNGDTCTTRKMTSYSYMGHDVKKNNVQFWIFGGLWQCLGKNFNNRIGPISVRIYHLIYVNLRVKYGSNLIRTLLIKILNMKNMVFSRIFEAIRGSLRIQGYQDTHKCRPHHIGDIILCTTRLIINN